MESYWDCLPEELKQQILWYRDHYTNHFQLLIEEQSAVLGEVSKQKKREKKKLRRLKRKLYCSVWATRPPIEAGRIREQLPASLYNFLKAYDFERHGDLYYRIGDDYLCRTYAREFRELKMEGWKTWSDFSIKNEVQLFGVAHRTTSALLIKTAFWGLDHYWQKKCYGELLGLAA